METIEINVDERGLAGSSASRRLRADGAIPAVVYSRGEPARMVTLNQQEYTRRMRGCGPTQLFKFKSVNKDLDGKLALLKDIDVEPIKDRVLHLDFLAVSAETKVIVAVPVELIGESAVVKGGEAVLNQSLREIELECFPTEIPKSIQVDISGLRLGHGIHAGDLQLPPGAALKTAKDLAVVSASHKKEVVEEKPVEAAAEGAVAEGAAAGEAAAPAAEEKKADKKEKSKE